ncbi:MULTISPECIES: SGNH/GDSL hydrolase family protein [Sphingobacterium]|uniref:SGNH/GDSL hydrolase family protein n=1 Tax=Sphingobacterium TaxID=28453 RepID=UPI0009F3B4A5|nr:MULTISPECIES: SGNH/GDSL hydrolase family protein [Sphingobacterium]HAL50913.1 G-D-S-L family lipolytic protein [Sphingobacterium sp.]HCX55310.1 G-D-S-L family lipolytic protein [Sphingobacterium sp.]
MLNLLLKTKKIRFLPLLLCFSIWYVQAVGQKKTDNFRWDDGQKVLFLGNSITYAGQYVAMTESLFLSSHPKRKPQFINSGLPSETVSGLSEPNHADGKFPRPCLFDRLDNVLDKIKPEVVFVCYGMNDGIYLPFDAIRFEAYKNGIIRLHKRLVDQGVKRILWMTPPVHDDPQLRLNGYNKVLDRYAEWLIGYAKMQSWEIIDLHFPMRRYLEAKIEKDAQFKLAADGVHPGELGHWLMAKEIVQHLMPDFPIESAWDDNLRSQPKLRQLYTLVLKRQTMMKDAWLTYTGHKRPGLSKGIPVEDASKAYAVIQDEIKALGF